MARAEYKAL